MKTTVSERPLRGPGTPATHDRLLRPGAGAQVDGGLPPDVLREAVQRLGGFALVAAVGMTTMLVLPALVPWIAIGNDAVRVPVQVAMIAISLALAWAALRGRLPEAVVLDVAPVYQVTAAAALAVIVNSGGWPEEPGLPGWSPVAVLVLVAPLVIPNTTPRVLATAAISAAMDPLAVVAMVQLGWFEMPTPDALAMRFFPLLIAVAAAVLVSRVVHHLGAKLTHAREMGSYRLVERLGTGGMGEVWRATHRMLAREAAVKLIRPEVLALRGSQGSGATATERFMREARAIAALRSPHTVRLYDFGVASDGTLYYVMELLDGVDLETLVREHGPQPPERVVHLLVQICRSLREAHEAHLVHRDVKPANVYLCRRYGGESDVAKVLDFGLVTASQLGSAPAGIAVTQGNVIAGTPAYLSPEMATGARPVEGRSDLYALGCVAYYLLTGQLVFEAQSAMEMAVMHATALPARPSSRTDLPIPAALEAIVMECLEKDLDRRPPSARALEARLVELAAELPWSDARAEAWWEARSGPVPPIDDEADADADATLDARGGVPQTQDR